MNHLAAFLLRIIGEAAWESNPPNAGWKPWRETGGPAWMACHAAADALDGSAS